MPSISHRPMPGLAAAAAALVAFSGTTSQATPVTLTYDFDLAVDSVFYAGSGTPVPGSSLIGQAGTASLTFDIDTAGLLAGDTLDLDNDDVSAFEATIFGQSFDETETTDVLASPFGSGDTPLATLVAGAAIGSDPFDLGLSFFGVGVSEIETLNTVAGVFTFAPARLTSIDADTILAFVALFDAGVDTGSFVAPSYTDGSGNDVTGDTAAASVGVGVVPVPPALAFSLTALAGLAAFGHRRARA